MQAVEGPRRKGSVSVPSGDALGERIRFVEHQALLANLMCALPFPRWILEFRLQKHEAGWKVQAECAVLECKYVRVS